MMTQPEIRKCPHCGMAFIPNSHNQRFCSYQCRWNNRAELRRLNKSSARTSVAETIEELRTLKRRSASARMTPLPQKQPENADTH